MSQLINTTGLLLGHPYTVIICDAITGEEVVCDYDVFFYGATKDKDDVLLRLSKLEPKHRIRGKRK